MSTRPSLVREHARNGLSASTPVYHEIGLVDCVDDRILKQLAHSYNTRVCEVDLLIAVLPDEFETSSPGMMCIPLVQSRDNQPRVSDLFHSRPSERLESLRLSCLSSGTCRASARSQTGVSMPVSAAPDHHREAARRTWFDLVQNPQPSGPTELTSPGASVTILPLSYEGVYTRSTLRSNAHGASPV